VQVSADTIARIQADRLRVLEALRVGVRAYQFEPDKIVGNKVRDIQTLVEWIDEFRQREQHGGLIIKP